MNNGQTRSLEERFWEKVEKTEGCWNWTAAKSTHGYGRIILNRKLENAHRVSYELLVGAIPEGGHLLHSCDNRRCVNPAHLTVGTHKQNMEDMSAKGRQWQQKKTHCKHGHEFTAANTYISPAGLRSCKTCVNHRGMIHKRSTRARIKQSNAA